MGIFKFLKSRPALTVIPPNEVERFYNRNRMRALAGVFIGYAAYYLVRNNFTLSAPYLMTALNLNNTEIGLLNSCMLISYGLSKGIMSSLADLCNPKRYMLLGLILSCMVNMILGFSTEFWMFFVLVVLNGVFQGMGAGPAFITIASWYPRMQRGRAGAIWNTSHNIGGGMVAPIAVGTFAVLGAQYWQAASYWIPSCVALLFALVFMYVGVGTTYNEGLPPVDVILPEDKKAELVKTETEYAPDNASAWTIFRQYVLPNKNVWYISIVDACIYLIRFGIFTWVPIYLLQEKNFNKMQMSTAFAVFEWSAIPATLLAGILSDKFFKGNRMPLLIICMVSILVALFFYWQSKSVLVVTIFCGLIGFLIYPPQFLASIVTMEIVPRFAVGTAVGLRGFMSYVVGATLGTALLGKLVDLYGWNAGFYLLVIGVLLCIVFSILCHFGTLKLKKEN